MSSIDPCGSTLRSFRTFEAVVAVRELGGGILACVARCRHPRRLPAEGLNGDNIGSITLGGGCPVGLLDAALRSACMGGIGGNGGGGGGGCGGGGEAVGGGVAVVVLAVVVVGGGVASARRSPGGESKIAKGVPAASTV